MRFSKAGASSGAPTRTPDNLKAKDTMEIVLGLLKGPIKGPVDGLTKNYIGNTPVQNSSGTLNFQKFEYYWRPGNETDDPIKFRLGGQSSSTTVGINLFSGTPVVRQTNTAQNGLFDVIEFRIVISALSQTNTKGDTLNNSAQFNIEYKAASSGTWKLAFPSGPWLDITGKTSSAYPVDYRLLVDVINEPYDLRVTKISPESTDSVVCEIAWESYQLVLRGDKQFPNLAVAQYIGEATDQFSSLPQFSGVYDLMLCRMPNAYNPYTRTWSGAWDGLTWKTDWTQNPALICNEIMANEDWGISAFLPPVSIDKWDLVEGIDWCDEPVPDGIGGYQPRYTYNGIITEPRAAGELVRFIAGIFGGTVYDQLDGVIRLTIDRDSDAVALFTPENTIYADGKNFNYTYTDNTTWYNDITVTFRNPNLDWEEDRRRVFLQGAIDTDGRIPLDLIAEGCIFDHEAVRRAQLRLITAQNEKQIVTLTTNKLGLIPELYSVFLVADPDMDYGISGRVKSLSVDRKTMTLRDAIYLEPAVDYNIIFQVPSGPVTVAIPGAMSGTLTSLIFPSALPAEVVATTTWAIEAPDEPSLPKPYKLVDVMEVDNQQDLIQLVGLEIDRTKQTNADAVTYQDPTEYSRPFDPSLIAAPTDLTATPTAIFDPTGLFVGVRLDWIRSTNKGVKGYEIWQSFGGGAPERAQYTDDTTIELQSLKRGPYTFYVYSVSILANVKSFEAATVDITLGDAPVTSVSVLSNLEILGQGATTTFVTPDVIFSWEVTAPPDYFPLGPLTYDGSGFIDPTISEYKIEILDATTSSVLFTDWTKNTFYNFTFDKNLKVTGGPLRSFKFRVRALDTYGRYTAAITLSGVSNAHPAVPTVASRVSALGVSIDITSTLDPDVVGFLVWASTTNGFTPSSGNLVFFGAAPIIFPASGNHTWYYKYAAYDEFGTSGVNVSSQGSFVTTGVDSGDMTAAVQTILGYATAAASDNILTPGEKVILVPQLKDLLDSYVIIDARAAVLGITTERAAFYTSITTLTTYLGTLTTPVAWDNLAGNTTVVGATLISDMRDAFEKRITLETVIAQHADFLGGVASATVLTNISNALSDNVMTPSEKVTVVPQIKGIFDSYVILDTRAATLGVTTERSAFYTSYSALVTLMGGYTTPVAWDNLAGNTTVVGATVLADVRDALEKRTTLETAIAKHADFVGGTAAATILTNISNALSDGILTPSDKLLVVPQIKELVNGQAALDARATTVGNVATEKTSFDGAMTTLNNYLATLTSAVAWDNQSGNTTIAVPATFIANLRDAMEKREVLRTAIAKNADFLGGVAAATVLADVSNSISDGVLTPGEKMLIVPSIKELVNGQATIDARATALSITTEKTSYDSAMTTLNSYLGGLISAVAWDNQTGNTTVSVPATFITNLRDAFEKRLVLLDAIDRQNANSLVKFGVNQIANSGFTQQNGQAALGWSVGVAGDTGLSVVTGWNKISGYFGQRNVATTYTVGTPASGKYIASCTQQAVQAEDWLAYSILCFAGDLVFGSIDAAAHNASSCYAQLLFYDSNFAQIGSPYSGTSAFTSGGGTNGDPANFTRQTVFAVAPTGTRYALLRSVAIANAADYLYLFTTDYMACILPAGQTAIPPYIMGPSARGDLFNNSGAAGMWGDNPHITAVGSTTITIQSVSIRSDGLLYVLPSGSITGLTNSTKYYVFYDFANLVYVTTTSLTTAGEYGGDKNRNRYYPIGVGTTSSGGSGGSGTVDRSGFNPGTF